MDTSANIFTPGVYHGLQDERVYSRLAADVSLVEASTLARIRAMRDGLFCIDNDLVGDDAFKMTEMIGFICDQENITRFYAVACREKRTIDFLCRDLANSSR